MLISTKVVVNIETGEILYRDAYEYSGTLALAESGAGKEADSLAEQEQSEQFKNADAAQGTLSQFEGPVNQSPFYKSLLTTNLENTSNQYQQAATNARARAGASGYGYSSPNVEGNEDAIAAQGAGALAEVPGQTLIQAAAPALQAAGTTAGMAGAEGNTAVSGFNVADRSQQAMWSTLASII